MIALLVFLLRAPIFGVSALDPDESMYLIIGREVLNGHLPFVTTFQEKPLFWLTSSTLASERKYIVLPNDI